MASQSFQEVGRMPEVGDVPEGIEYTDGNFKVMKRLYPPPVGGGPQMVWLAIRHIKGEKQHTWGDYQYIKNELAGEEWIGFEMYPAESNMQNTSDSV